MHLESAWRTHIPSFLNAVSTVGAFGHQLLGLTRQIEAERQKCDKLSKDAATKNEQIDLLRKDVGAKSEQIDHLWRDVGAKSEQIDQLWKNVSTKSEQIDQLWQRIEFVRQETLFEYMHGDLMKSHEGTKEAPEPRILSHDKVQAAITAGNVRLNLGCGHVALMDFINVDMRELPGVDVVAQVDRLPFAPSTVSEIFSAHLIEHFPQEALLRRLLPYWKSLLKTGGTLRAITPDAEAMISASCAGNYPFEYFREVLFGLQEYEGDFHYNLLTPDSMRTLLENAHFEGIEIPTRGRRNGKCFEFEIIGRQP